MAKFIDRLFLHLPLWWFFGLALIIKLILAFTIPITGDEAYWAFCGRELHWGYYCHPPMVVWVLYFLMKISDALFLLRLPAVACTLIIAVLIYRILRNYDSSRARIFTTIFLLSPLNLFFVIISTDTFVVFFLFLAVAALFKSRETKHTDFYCFLSGVFLGLAALSKYFVFLMVLAFCVYYLYLWMAQKESLGSLSRKLIMTALGFIPLIMPNIIWNYCNGWPNIMFNVYNRNVHMTFSVATALTFMAINIYLMTPHLAVVFFRNVKAVYRNFLQSSFQPIYFAYFTPILALLFLSFFRPIGLHWPLAFYMIFFLMIFDVFKHLDDQKLLKILRTVLYFSLAHLVVAAVVLAGREMMLDRFKFKNPKHTATIAMVVYPEQVVGLLKDEIIAKGDFQLATEGYSSASLLEYFLKKDVIVFGRGHYHGRHHDVTTDFRKLDGKNILIFRRGVISEDKIAFYRQFFNEVKIITLEIKNATYPVVLGYGFKYPHYAQTVLCQIKKRYYNIPDYLPYKKTFLDRYELDCD
jgi:hypothetical protein